MKTTIFFSEPDFYNGFTFLIFFTSLSMNCVTVILTVPKQIQNITSFKKKPFVQNFTFFQIIKDSNIFSYKIVVVGKSLVNRGAHE